VTTLRNNAGNAWVLPVVLLIAVGAIFAPALLFIVLFLLSPGLLVGGIIAFVRAQDTQTKAIGTGVAVTGFVLIFVVVAVFLGLAVGGGLEGGSEPLQHR
jgi:hypothetical protein